MPWSVLGETQVGIGPDRPARRRRGGVARSPTVGGMYPGEHAKDHPDEPALIMEPSGAQLTFAEYEANCNRLAHLFRSVGLQRGDHVAMFLENNLRYFELQGAAERAGLYYTCVNSYL